MPGAEPVTLLGVAVTHFLGVDLAWREGRDGVFPAGESAMAVVVRRARVLLDAG